MGKQVFGFIYDAGFEHQNLVIVTPEGGGDSAHRHAYDLPKAWNLPREQIHSVVDLQYLDLSKAVLILFNDTYGSGKQFTREIWPRINSLSEKPLKIILVAVTIAEAALKKFRSELPDVHIVPDEPALSALDVFSEGEFQRLKELGQRVYPEHPIGFGDTALLTAYYFQCPNNSLPLIWANGKNNAASGHPARPWSPLFPYYPKTRSTSFPASIIHEEEDSQKLVSNLADVFAFETLTKRDMAEVRQNEIPSIEEDSTLVSAPQLTSTALPTSDKKGREEELQEMRAKNVLDKSIIEQDVTKQEKPIVEPYEQSTEENDGFRAIISKLININYPRVKIICDLFNKESEIYSDQCDNAIKVLFELNEPMQVLYHKVTITHYRERMTIENISEQISGLRFAVQYFRRLCSSSVLTSSERLNYEKEFEKIRGDFNILLKNL